MDTLRLKIPKELTKKLVRPAKEKGLSQSEIIRRALQDYFTDDNLLMNSTFLEFTENLAGSIEGLSDISANKKYLEGYGH